MPSFKVGVKTKHNPDAWVFNGLRFNSKFDAESYASTLSRRWNDVTECFVFDTVDPPNCTLPVPSDRYPVSRGKGEPDAASS